MKKGLCILTVSFLLSSLNAFANSDVPQFDKKLKDDQRADKCADWARGLVHGDKKKSAEYKDQFQKCLSKNGLPSSLAFSGKYKL